MGQAGTPKLKVGDAAPPLKVARWLKGSPVTRYEPGTIYVVEFWASWCGPCKEAIPTLTQLQKKFGKSVQIVGVDVWEKNIAAAIALVKKKGATMDYTVALDASDAKASRHGPMALSFLKAADVRGIPASFVIDGKGKIAWIGNADGLEQAIDDVVAGRKPLSGHFQNSKDLARLRAEMADENAYFEALRTKNWPAAEKSARRMISVGNVQMGYPFLWQLYAKHQPNFPKALEVAREARGNPKAEFPGLIMEVETEILMGDNAAAMRTTQVAMEGKYGNDPMFLLSAADTLSRSTDQTVLVFAEKLASKSLTLTSEPHAGVVHAKILWRLGRHEEADAEFQAVLKKPGLDSSIVEWLKQVYAEAKGGKG